MVKWLGRWLLRMVAGVTAVAVILLLTGLLTPQLLVNNITIGLLKPIAAVAGYSVDWLHVDLSVRSRSLLQKDLSLRYRGLRVTSNTIHWEGERGAAAVGIDLHPRRTFVRSLGPIMLTDSQLELSPEPADPPSKEQPLDLTAIRSLIAGREYHPIEIREFNWLLHGEKDDIGGEIDAGLVFDESGGFSLEATASFEGVQPIRSLTLSVRHGDEAFAINAQAQLKSGGTARMVAEVAPPTETVWPYDVQFEWRDGGQRLLLDARGSGNRQHLLGFADLKFSTARTGGIELELDDCRIGLTSADLLSERLGGNIGCDGRFRRPDMGWESRLKKDLLPRQVAFRWLADIDLLVEPTTRVLDVATRLTANQSGTLQFGGEIEAKAVIALNRPTAPRVLQLESDLQLNAPRFERVVTDLGSTELAVYAPFHQLKGPISCVSHGEFNLADRPWRIPLECNLRLRSDAQRLDADVISELVYDADRPIPRLQIATNVALNHVALSLPNIDLRSPFPRLTIDPRIERASTHSAEPPTIDVDYNIRVHTTQSDAIKVINNLTDGPLPIELDLRMMSGQGMFGDVRIGGGKLEFLKRRAEAKYLVFRFPRDSEEIELDGKIELINPDYKMFLIATGTLTQPRFRLLTDPPLSEDEAVSVLLYGERFDSLDEESRESASQTAAAMADNAIGLVSMYYLASTPVDSIGYDQQSGLLTANFRLPSGARVTVGRDDEAANVIGFQKRLGRNWRVETTLRTADNQGREGRGGAFLRWGKRF